MSEQEDSPQEDSPIEYMIRCMLEDHEIEIDPAQNALGLKASVGELFSEEVDGEIERLFLQFYVQATIPDKPENDDLGFTREEVKFQSGVVLADVLDQTDPPNYYGEVLEVDKFLEEYLETPQLKQRVTRVFENLKVQATPKESWLSHVSTMHNDRLPGEKSAIRRPRMC